MKTAVHSSGRIAGLSVGQHLEINVVLIELDTAEDIPDLAAVHLAQVAPYPLPLARPPVAVELTQRSLRDLVSKQRVETSATLYLCRERNGAIRRALRPELIVLCVRGAAGGARSTGLSPACSRATAIT